MQQPELELSEPRSRLTAQSRALDPATSRLAAAAIERTGRAEHQRRLCLDAIRRQPGMTTAEVAAVTGLERHAPSRRLPELRVDGLVDNGDPRPCSVMGRLSLTWFPKGGAA